MTCTKGPWSSLCLKGTSCAPSPQALAGFGPRETGRAGRPQNRAVPGCGTGCGTSTSTGTGTGTDTGGDAGGVGWWTRRAHVRSQDVAFVQVVEAQSCLSVSGDRTQPRPLPLELTR